MVSVALRPRMIGLLLLFLLAAAVCARLGVWQLDRAHERGDLADRQAAAEAQNQGPEGLGALLEPQSTFPGDLVGRQAWVEGEYVPGTQMLVEGRAHDGEPGFLVLTAMRVSEDGTGGASWADLSGAPVLPVVRGWVPATTDGSDPDVDASVLAEPAGTVRLAGYLQASEALGQGSSVPGRTDSISSASLANVWGGPIYSGYLVVSSSQPSQADAIVLLDRPSIEGGDGLNLQNLFYALQWWIFGGFAVLLWLRLVRDETRGEEKSADEDPFGALARAEAEA
jgi:cytochrome oxidase assembly protein ShyY1